MIEEDTVVSLKLPQSMHTTHRNISQKKKKSILLGLEIKLSDIAFAYLA